MGSRTMLALAVMATCAALVTATGDCYSYYDHAAQYQLDHKAKGYPWDEVEAAMKQNPQLSDIMAKGTLVPTSRPPGQHYYTPVSVVCPSDRYMLKAFTLDNRKCWVIKPEVQQLRYTHCSEKNNRDCHYCNYNNQGGISKCEEDYEWQTVWAYCKHSHVPSPYQPQPHPYPVYPRPSYPSPYHPKPTLGYPHTKPSNPYHPYPNPGKVYYPAKLYAKKYYNDPYVSKRWKRTPYGSVEKISLYLPYQCSCKSFKC